MDRHCEIVLFILQSLSDHLYSISPSVYVAYRSLGAAANCPAFGPKYFPEGDSIDTTIGYPPEALSTSMCNGPPAGWQLYTAINYTELQYPTGSQTRGTCEWRLNESGTPRGPYLSIPQDIIKVKPAWATCTGAFEGTFDPPKTLQKASAMVAPTPGPDPSPPAKPGPSITPANPPPTASPATFDPGAKSEPPPAEPAKSDPGNSGSVGNGSPSNSDPGNSGSNSGNSGSNGSNRGGSNGGGSDNGASNNDGSNIGGSISGGSNSDSAGNSDPNNGGPNNSNPASSSGGQDSPQAGKGPQESPDHPSNSNPTNPQPASGNGGSHAGAPPAVNPQASNNVVADGNTIVRDPGGGVVVADSTYMPGSTAQLSGTLLSVALDHVVVGGSSYALPAAATATPVLVGDQSVVKAQGGGVAIGGLTVAAGAQTAVAGHTVLVDSSHIVVDGSTYALPPSPGAVVQAAAPTPKPVQVEGQSLIRAPNGGIIIGGITIGTGSAATIAGHFVSANPSAAIVDGTTYALPTTPGAIAQQAPNLKQNIAAHSALTLANGAIITAGGNPATVDGTVIAIPSDDNGLIINGKTVPPTAVPLPTAPPSSVFTVAGQTFTAAATGFTIGSQTLTPGGAGITVSGTIISLGASGLQIGTSTVSLPPVLQSVFTVAGQTFTAAPTGFAIGTQSLTEGGSAVTLAGTMISLGPAGLVIGTKATPLTPAEQSADTADLGGLILGGLGANPTGETGNDSSVVPFTGTGQRSTMELWSMLWIALNIVLIILIS